MHSDGVPQLDQSFDSLASFPLGQPFKILVQLKSSLRLFLLICFISQNNHTLETDTDSLEKSSSTLDFMLQITQQCSRTFARNLITQYSISLVNSFHSHSLFSLNSFVLSNPSVLTRILAYLTTHSLLYALALIQSHCHSLIPNPHNSLYFLYLRLPLIHSPTYSILDSKLLSYIQAPSL